MPFRDPDLAADPCAKPARPFGNLPGRVAAPTNELGIRPLGLASEGPGIKRLFGFIQPRTSPPPREALVQTRDRRPRIIGSTSRPPPCGAARRTHLPTSVFTPPEQVTIVSHQCQNAGALSVALRRRAGRPVALARLPGPACLTQMG